MSETEHELGLNEEDRLPWLEAVEDDDDDDRVDSARMFGFVLVALAALGLVIGGVWWMRNRASDLKGDGTVIASPEGDYKVRPDAPGGMKVDGQGDTAFAASGGAEANGKVDMSAQPEAPVAGTKAVTVAKPAMVAKPAVTEVVRNAAPRVVPPAPAPSMGNGSLVQLGAYGSSASAEQAWSMLSRHYAELAPLSKSILPAAVGGSTVYRLRANAGSAGTAASLCGKLKAGGASCMVVN
jgi:SPOR domain